VLYVGVIETEQTPMTEQAYTVTPARYSKGNMAVRCPSSTGYKTRAAYLAHRLANGRYTNREHAYIMSATAAKRFEKLYAEGWDVSFSGVLTPPKIEDRVQS
jgi:hypothetical protein